MSQLGGALTLLANTQVHQIFMKLVSMKTFILVYTMLIVAVTKSGLQYLLSRQNAMKPWVEVRCSTHSSSTSCETRALLSKVIFGYTKL